MKVQEIFVQIKQKFGQNYDILAFIINEEAQNTY